MKTATLSNGIKVIQIPASNDICCVFLNVKVGSNHEPAEIAGISHFIEHMLFEGTKKRPDSFAISNEIEKYGGELNAATSNERTFFYAKVPAKRFGLALDVISDIACNPIFSDKLIEKEKGIVVDEIKMINDQPRFYQWILFENTLFRKHPAGRPIYGKIETVENLSRDKILEYYNRHYVAENMTLLVVGGVKDVVKMAEEAFANVLTGKAVSQSYTEPVHKERVFKEEKRGTEQAYMIMGYNTVPRANADSYALDILRAVMGRGQSGRIFNEVRNKRGLAYDVGVLHSPSTDFGFFAIYVNTNQKNVEKAEKIIVEELLKDISEKEIDEAKAFLEGEYLLQAEDSQKLAETVAFWDQVGEDAGKYVERVMAVSSKEVVEVVGKYFCHPTVTLLS